MNPQLSPALDARIVCLAPPGFQLLAKPGGSICNIDCRYCFFLSKEALYPDERHKMTDATLEEYIRQLLESHRTPEVTVIWQGGEPTLMGVDFFRRAVDLVKKHRRPDQRVQHALQTNGIALNDEWCAFLKANRFLVGLSVDGPRVLHDTYRLTRGGEGTFDLVMKGWERLRMHQVEFNILCTVNAANQQHGRVVYRFLREELRATWIQFIPIAERATAETIQIANLGWRRRPQQKRPLYTQTGSLVTERSVDGRAYGQFLVDVFEEWVRHDVGSICVQLFDATLGAHFGRYTLCTHAPTCGLCPALEYNGDLYACDHYVEPDFKLGNIHHTHMLELVASSQQREFGRNKQARLTLECRECEVRVLCNGGCPKDRFVSAKDGEPGHNYLCAGLYLFYTHTRSAMEHMADLLAQGRAPAEIMAWVAAQDGKRGPYAPCPCGSGRKFRFCHGAREAPPIVVSRN